MMIGVGVSPTVLGTMRIPPNGHGGAPPGDTTAPGTPGTLVAQWTDATHFTFTWVAAGDDGAVGTAAYVEVRQSTSPITTEGHWDAATVKVGPYAANAIAGGSPDSYAGTGVKATGAYVAVRYKDEADNVGAFAAVLVADVTAPGTPGTLAAEWDSDTAFTFSWVAAGDDGAVGTAAYVEVRQATAPITTEQNWTDASVVLGPWATNTVPGGTADHYHGTGNRNVAQEYVAVRYRDAALNVGAFASTQVLDTQAPSAATNASCYWDDFSTLIFDWTAGGDPAGTVWEVEVRKSQNEITAGNWSSATIVRGPWSLNSVPFGSPDAQEIAGEQSVEPLYVAVRYRDAFQNVSAVVCVPCFES